MTTVGVVSDSLVTGKLIITLMTGGKYFATGGTDRIIRVYQCVPGPPTVMAEIETHTVAPLLLNSVSPKCQ